MCIDNEKYNLPCPYNPKVLCVQMPCEPEDDNCCDNGCPHSPKTKKRNRWVYGSTFKKG